MFRGKCIQVLLEKIKYDPDCDKAGTSYNTLQILLLIEKTLLDQTKYQYIFAMVYKQECSIYIFIQNTLSNKRWYEQFNTKIDVGSDISVTLQHQVLLSHVTY